MLHTMCYAIYAVMYLYNKVFYKMLYTIEYIQYINFTYILLLLLLL